MLQQRLAQNTRPAAVALGAAAVLWVVVSSHHPSLGHGYSRTALARLQPIDGLFHALVLGLIFAMLYGLAVYAFVRVREPSLALIGFILFLFGGFAIVSAGLIDGFFEPAYAALSAGPLVSPQASAAMVMAGGLAIQILSKFGFVVWGIAAALWGIDLIASNEKARLAGCVMTLAGLALAVATLLLGTLRPHNLALIAVCMFAWSIIIAAELWHPARSQ